MRISGTASDDETRRVLVWDLPVRVVHWSLVLLIPLAWWTYEVDRMALHRLAGYAVLALMAFRVFWGFAGSQTARFANFLAGPRKVTAYLFHRATHSVGHNPLGGWSVAALLSLLCAQSLLGLFAADQDGLDSGPLAVFISDDHAETAEGLHAILFYALLALIALHLLAIIFYALCGKNLVGPMLSGRAALAVGVKAPLPAGRIQSVVAVLLAMSVFASLRWWGG